MVPANGKPGPYPPTSGHRFPSCRLGQLQQIPSQEYGRLRKHRTRELILNLITKYPAPEARKRYVAGNLIIVVEEIMTRDTGMR